MMTEKREQTLFQDQAVVGRLDASNCLSFVDPSAFAHESCIKGAIHARGGVLKSTLVVDNDKQCTMYIHTQLPSVPQS